MRFAADLHLHSRYAGGVSPKMTLENIARWAQLKGVDLLGTGDCLQGDWLKEIEATLVEAEPGFFALRPELEEKIARTLPASVRRSLRWLLSTEVHCAPPGTRELGGIHHLIYFPTVESARRFREKMWSHGHLEEGRPMLNLDSRQLFEAVLAHDEACHLAPAHVFNPWYSTLGTTSGGRTVEEVFGELASCLLAVETGLTSTPQMCRRVSSLDRFTLYSNSDAHSLENIGRECTVLEIEPSYDALFAALRTGDPRALLRTWKFPLERTRYYLNRCGICQESFDAQKCPHCGRALVMGARDRLEIVADRSEPVFPRETPPFRELLPLADVIGELLGVKRDNASVSRLSERLVAELGHERFILTEATHEAIAQASTGQLARAIVEQRTITPRGVPKKDDRRGDDQLSLGI